MMGARVVTIAIAVAAALPAPWGPPAAQAVSATGPGTGYWFVAGDGGVFTFGPSALFQGSAGDIRLNQPIVGMAPTPDGSGYWLVAQDGGIFTYGDAVYYGSTGAMHLNQPIVGMAATVDGAGYWLLAADGGVFSFGDALFQGSAVRASGPAVAISADPSGAGYRILERTGVVIAFGVPNRGSYNAAVDPAVGMATAPNGGYWIVTRSGAVFSFGADDYGRVTTPLNSPIVGMATTPDGAGYYLLGGDGGVFSFGDAAFEGSTGNLRLNSPVLGVAVPSRAASGATVSLSGSNSGDVVNVHPGDTITMNLTTCSGCGSTWSVVSDRDPRVLMLNGESDVPQRDPSFEMQVFTFTAGSPGSSEVTLSNTDPAGSAVVFGVTVSA